MKLLIVILIATLGLSSCSNKKRGKMASPLNQSSPAKEGDVSGADAAEDGTMTEESDDQSVGDLGSSSTEEEQSDSVMDPNNQEEESNNTEEEATEDNTSNPDIVGNLITCGENQIKKDGECVNEAEEEDSTQESGAGTENRRPVTSESTGNSSEEETAHESNESIDNGESAELRALATKFQKKEVLESEDYEDGIKVDINTVIFAGETRALDAEESYLLGGQDKSESSFTDLKQYKFPQIALKELYLTLPSEKDAKDKIFDEKLNWYEVIARYQGREIKAYKASYCSAKDSASGCKIYVNLIVSPEFSIRRNPVYEEIRSVFTLAGKSNYIQYVKKVPEVETEGLLLKKENSPVAPEESASTESQGDRPILQIGGGEDDQEDSSNTSEETPAKQPEENMPSDEEDLTQNDTPVTPPAEKQEEEPVIVLGDDDQNDSPDDVRLTPPQPAPPKSKFMTSTASSVSDVIKLIETLDIKKGIQKGDKYIFYGHSYENFDYADWGTWYTNQTEVTDKVVKSIKESCYLKQDTFKEKAEEAYMLKAISGTLIQRFNPTGLIGYWKKGIVTKKSLKENFTSVGVSQAKTLKLNYKSNNQDKEVKVYQVAFDNVENYVLAQIHKRRIVGFSPDLPLAVNPIYEAKLKAHIHHEGMVGQKLDKKLLKAASCEVDVQKLDGLELSWTTLRF